MATNSAAKSKQGRPRKYLLVRHGQMNALGLFEHNETEIPKTSTRVVVKSKRGLELGHLVGQLTTYKSGQFRLSRGQLKDYFNKSEIDQSCEPVGRLVRFATKVDVSEERHLKVIVKEEIKCCQAMIDKLDLPMTIVDAEHILGGERIIFYFRSDGRVDFRDLVKKLAQEYQTRIEMRQVGSRDEAKLLGDVESCGQQCCCQRFLRALKPVNMRMAKTQKATLDPAKISGYCGRLKCCLRFEDENYTELKRRLPKRNTLVKTAHGKGRVINSQILTQLVMVEHENGERIAIALEDIEILAPAKKQKKQKPANTENKTETDAANNDKANSDNGKEKERDEQSQ